MRKLFTTLLILLLVMVPMTSNAEETTTTGTSPFTDVKVTDEIYDAVVSLTSREIIKGYPDGSYKPLNAITRGQAAKILAGALELDTENVVNPEFTDVPESHEFYKYIAALQNADIISGYLDGRYGISDNLKRSQMAKIISIGFEFPEEELTDTRFTDVDPAAPYAGYIQALLTNEITKGTTATTFSPGKLVTRGQMASFIVRSEWAVSGEKPDPKPEPTLTFDVATILADGSTSVVKAYGTYEEAAANLKSGQAIQVGKNIIQMPNGGGIVVTKPTTASLLTNIYTAKDLKTARTYVVNDTELEYVQSTDKFVEIKVAGVRGFIKPENSILMPWKAMKGRSYYTASDDRLMHYIYQPAKGNYVSYQTGKAPSFITEGERYYSWDGVNFTNSGGTVVGTAYQYFQYLPARSKTDYTAEEIDAYIIDFLTGFDNDGTALEKSKLKGIGQYLKQVEEEKHINALLILALAQHESAYGLSTQALKNNNLFGLRVYDDNPANQVYETVESNIDDLVDAFLNRNYIPPNAQHANGAVFGNKAVGFNMKYASDPYWGAKAAGHWYRIDKSMGGRDLAQGHRIGFTTEVLNVRTTPDTNIARAFNYEKVGIPVLIKENVESSPWLKIVSDSVNFEDLYVHGDYIREISDWIVR